MKKSADPILEELFMREVLLAWRKDWRMYNILRKCSVYLGTSGDGEVLDILRRDTRLLTDAYFDPRRAVQVWLARNFRPVSDALYDGVTDADALALWKRTPLRVIPGVTNRCVADKEGFGIQGYKFKVKQQEFRMGRQIFAWGWRAKHDWKTVK